MNRWLDTIALWGLAGGLGYIILQPTSVYKCWIIVVSFLGTLINGFL